MVYATSEEPFVTDFGNRRMLLAFHCGANTDCNLDNSDFAFEFQDQSASKIRFIEFDRSLNSTPRGSS